MSLPTVTAFTRFSNASGSSNPSSRRSRSLDRAAPSAASASPSTRRCRPPGRPSYNNISVSGGPAPVRAYIEELLPDVLQGRIEPGRVFDRTGSINDVPDGYRAMAERECLKFQIEF
jgi:hypothetical protein